MAFKRRFVKLEDISLHKPEEIVGSKEYNWNKCAHALQPDGSYKVNQKVDGKTTQDHLEGTQYIKEQLLKGNKIWPPLVLDLGNGKYRKLDGFKRLKAYEELVKEGHDIFRYVEVIICDKWKERNGEMQCRGGGQHYTKFKKLLEGDEGKRPRNTVLARASYFRLELRENIHCHWGNKGRWRVVLGKDDFLELAKAFEEVDI